MKTQTRILDNRLYNIRKIELHRKGKTSRSVCITPIVICSSGGENSVLITVRRVHYGKIGKVPTTLTKGKEPCLPHYLLIVGGRIIGFIPFPMVLVLWELYNQPRPGLNSCHRVRFLQRWTLHHGYLTIYHCLNSYLILVVINATFQPLCSPFPFQVSIKVFSIVL